MRFQSNEANPVLDVVDAEAPLNFSLKEKDGDDAVCRSPSSCVLANALLRNRKIAEAQVGAGVVMVRFAKTPDVWTRYLLKGREKKMAATFDKHGLGPTTAAMMHGNELTIHPFPEGRKVGQSRRTTPRSNKREGLKSSVYRRHLAVEPKVA